MTLKRDTLSETNSSIQRAMLLSKIKLLKIYSQSFICRVRSFTEKKKEKKVSGEKVFQYFYLSSLPSHPHFLFSTIKVSKTKELHSSLKSYKPLVS